jgi:hypothetical protein
MAYFKFRVKKTGPTVAAVPVTQFPCEKIAVGFMDSNHSLYRDFHRLRKCLPDKPLKFPLLLCSGGGLCTWFLFASFAAHLLRRWP